MIVPGSANPLLLGDDGYNIQRSLRFRSSASAYLNKAVGYTGSRSVMTHSVWVKRGTIGSEAIIFSTYLGSTVYDYFGFNSSNQLQLVFVSSGTTYINLTTTAVFRDPSAWYHIVLKCDGNQASGSRWLLYVNGVQQSFTGTDSTNNILWGDATSTHQLNRNQINGTIGDQYLAEYNFVGGQALTSSSFGQTDPATGVWTPKKYTGTYGTNGFYLPFSDNTSATTLAYDKSGNGNNWTPNNISTTAGATYDSMTDVPTLTSATAANYCVLNPVGPTSATINNANLQIYNGAAAHYTAKGTLALPSNTAIYFEALLDYNAGANSAAYIGFATEAAARNSYQVSGIWSFGGTAGVLRLYDQTTQLATPAGSAVVGDILQCAYDGATGKVWFGKNNTWYDASGGTTGNPSAKTNQTATTTGEVFPWADCYANAFDFNFGQRPFSYTPPTGFKALNTFNLPDPVIKKPNQYMDVVTNTGNGTSRFDPTNFAPDLVWSKSRSASGFNIIQDSVRGAGNRLITDGTYAELSDSTYGSFAANGFTFGSNANVNTNGVSYVDWFWKKGATPGFDIVTASISGAGTVNHNLGVAPAFVITKWRGGAANWFSWHKSFGATQVINLNTTAAVSTDATIFGAAPTSTTISFGTAWNSGGPYNLVAYLFAEIAGFSKFGSYTGNGSADGPFVYCGFRPKYVLMKITSGLSDWCIWDSSRSQYNATNNMLYADLSDAEQANNTALSVDLTSNGFKIRGSNNQNNGSGATYIFAAFAENPFKYSNAR